MTKIVWDKSGERFYETGVDHGVLYLLDQSNAYTSGVPWNGLVSVNAKPTGAEANPQYADNMKYLNLLSLEEFEATLEAFTYPKEFAECDGTRSPKPGVTIGQQPRKMFGLVWRSLIGNDMVGTSLGYKLHLAWNVLASPTEKNYQTVNESPEALTFTWDMTTTPVSVTGYAPTSYMCLDSRDLESADLLAIEEVLFGGATKEPSLPMPDAILALI